MFGVHGISLFEHGYAHGLFKRVIRRREGFQKAGCRVGPIRIALIPVVRVKHESLCKCCGSRIIQVRL